MGRRKHYKNNSVSLGGTNATIKALEAMGEEVIAAAKEALRQEAERVAQDAKNRCPVYEGTKKKDGSLYIDVRVKPGALRDSIKVTEKKNGEVCEISANARAEDGFLYGQVVEFSPKINRPFLYPALDANRASVYKNIEQAILRACGIRR